MQLHWTSLMYEDECTVVSNENNATNDNFSRDRDGRLVGTTIVSKHENKLRRVKVHNDISMKYTVERRSLPYGKRLPRDRLNEVTESITSKYDLYSSDICSITIRKRVTRSDNIIVHPMYGGHVAKVEDKPVGLIIQVARIRHPLTQSSCLQLANHLISGTQSESNVLDFKNKCSFNKSKDY